MTCSVEMSAATSGAYAMEEHEGGSARAAFVALYREHASFTWGCLRRLGVPPAAIDDAMQELWVTAHRRIATLHGPASAKAWLYGIARRVASHHRRSERRHRRKLDALEHSPPRDAGSREDELVIESILAQLDARVREAFVLSELEGWSAPEIARATGANTNTIYWRVRVARQELQTQLGEDEAGAQVIQLRDATRPPRGAARHCWVLIAPKLAKPSLIASMFGSLGVAKAIAIGAVATVVTVTVVDVGARDTAVPRSDVAQPIATPEARDDRPRAVDAPAVLPASPVEPEAPTAIAATPAPARPAPAPLPAARPAPTPAPMPDDRLAAADTELLRDAKVAFAAGKLSDARAALHEHRQRFPESRLADVRDLLEVELACKNDDVATARTLADAITSRAPTSAAARKLDSTCVGGAQ
jgi:RNA polymerase sigma factor (sigma-70 family)